MRRQAKILLAVAAVVAILVLLTVPKLYVVSLDNNIAFSAGGGMADVQTFGLIQGTEFSGTFLAYPANTTIVLFSIQSPDGSFVLRNQTLRYEISFSYFFVAGQSGSYKFIFGNPYPSLGSNVAANITFHEPLIFPYQPQDQMGNGNEVTPLNQSAS